MSRWLMNRMLALAAVVMLAGCGASGPKFEAFRPVPPDSALVYFYHQKVVVPMDVLIDGQQVAQLLDRSFVPIEVKPGQREILVNAPLVLQSWRMNMRFEANTTYAIELDGSQVGFIFGPMGWVTQTGSRRLVVRSLEEAAPVLRTLNEVTKK
jgi:hypothetical protein